MTEIVNLFDAERKQDEGDPPGYEVPYARLGPLLGASNLGMTVYELNEGQSICPYHYEYPEEEWLIVLEGHPTLRVSGRRDGARPGRDGLLPDRPRGRPQGDEPNRPSASS